MKILVTGAAGFIGFHLSSRLIKEGYSVIGLDNLNSYYDKKLKIARLEELKKQSLNDEGDFSLYEFNLENKNSLYKLFTKYNPQFVVNLAAQAGVRYSIENPDAYISSNILGFSNILECCRNFGVKHLIYASSSSVYGGNTNTPFKEQTSVDHPVSLYAATKKSNELMAHSYSHLYDIPSTGLRFFTVYGPWGRPDMALFLFTKAILNGESIKIFNRGEMVRDFTYIDDIIESLFRLIFKIATKDNNFNTSMPNPSSSFAPHRIFNIGNSQPTPLMDYIFAIERELDIVAKKEFLPMQPGDVKVTAADTSLLEDWVNFKPNTSISVGVSRFISWYKKFYNINN
tara:strand:+ start:41 stop:1069 length:1029 start_codon:yes stop_codon:yes gene_type:complete